MHGGNVAVGARLVVNHHRHIGEAAELGRDAASGSVGGAARRERHDQRDAFGREVLRMGERGAQQKKGGYEVADQGTWFHGLSPMFSGRGHFLFDYLKTRIKSKINCSNSVISI